MTACAVDKADEVHLEISNNSFSVPCIGGTYSIEVTSNAAWSVSTVGSGIGVDRMSGSGNGTVGVTVEANRGEQLTELVEIRSEGDFPVTALCRFERESYPTIAIDRPLLSFDYSASTQYITVSCNKAWTTESDSEFVTVEPSSGLSNGEVQIVVSANAERTDRVAKVLFKADSQVEMTAELTVEQRARSTVEFVDRLLSVGRDGGRFTVAVDANVEWSVRSVSADFVSVEAIEGGVVVTVEPNEGDSRQAEVTIGDGTIESVLLVMQQPNPRLMLSTTSIQAPLAGGEFTVALQSNTSWSASIEGDDCIESITPVAGDGDASVVVLIKASQGIDRSAVVTFTTEGEYAVSAQLSVTQDSSPMIAVSPISIKLTGASQSFALSIASNTLWSVTGRGDWIESVDPASGQSDCSVNVTVGENNGSKRSTNIVFETTGGLRSASIEVTQAAALEVQPASLSFDYLGATDRITVTSHQRWSASVDNDAFVLSAQSGEGSGVIDVTAAQNTTSALRNATVTIVAEGGMVCTVSIVQPRATVNYGGVEYDIVLLRDNRWWFADNLRYVPAGCSVSSDPAAESGLWYPYSYDSDTQIPAPLTDAASIERFGYFYDAAAAFARSVTADNYTSLESVRGICPQGWHIPTQGEVVELQECYKRADAKTYIEDLVADGWRFTPCGMRQKGSPAETGRYSSSQSSDFLTLSTGSKFNESSGTVMMRGMIFNGNNGTFIVADQSATHGGHIRCIKDR